DRTVTGVQTCALPIYGARDVRIDNVPEPNIEKPTDVLVKLTSTNICGSDLHMYDGRTDVETGKVLGHENLGEIVEVGKTVERFRSEERRVGKEGRNGR